MTPNQIQRGLLILLTVASVAPGPIRLQAKPDSVGTPLALTHVTVIDATGSPAQRDMTVLVDGGRIRALGKTADLSVPG